MGSLIRELKRRRVFRVLVGYGIVSFAVLQVAEPIMHALNLPESTLKLVVVLLGLGFPLAVVLAWAFDVDAGRVTVTPAAAGAQAPRGSWLALALVGLGLLAAAPGLLYYFVLRGAGRAAPAPGPAAGERAIAVLPFVNISSDKENDYLSDGLTEELINALANVEGLRVASRTAVFALKGRSAGIQQLGAELNVDTLLEGSVRREGTALRVTAQLIDVGDGYHLWSKTYDREVKSLFAVEDEISRAIASALRRKLVPLKLATASSEAHDLYLQGLFAWNQRTAASLRRAAGLFEEAARVDPDYALAHVGLADSIALLIDYDTPRASEILPRARASALRALELDPGLAEAHASLGNIAWHQYDWEGASAHLRRAIEIKPGYATAHQWYAEVLSLRGRLPEARAEIDRAMQLDPRSSIIAVISARISLILRDYETAASRQRAILEKDPDFEMARFDLIWTYRLQGRCPEALAEMEKMRSFPASTRKNLRGQLYALCGRRPQALAILRELEETARTQPVAPSAFAFIWMALGDKDQAFARLKESCAAQEPWMFFVKLDPLFDSLRSDPRYAALLACVHLE